MRRLALASSARQYAAPGSLRALSAEAGDASGGDAGSLGRGRGRGAPLAADDATPDAPGAPGRGRGRGLAGGSLLSRVFSAPTPAKVAKATLADAVAPSPPNSRPPREGPPREITTHGRGRDAQPAAGVSGRPELVGGAQPRASSVARGSEGGGREYTLRRGPSAADGEARAGGSGRLQQQTRSSAGESAMRSRSPQGQRRDGAGRDDATGAPPVARATPRHAPFPRFAVP